MVNAWMIITCIVMIVVTALVCFYFLVYFSSDEDSGRAWLPKFIVLIGLMSALLLVLILPLDVANRSLDGGFDMELVWQIAYLVVAVLVVVIMPFAIFYYDSVEEGKGVCHQFGIGIMYSFIFLVAFGALVAVLYTTVGSAIINYQVVGTQFSDIAVNVTSARAVDFSSSWEIKVSLVVYIIAILALVGWVMFTVFVGIGFIALPADLITDFAKRVRRPSSEEIAAFESNMRDRVRKLLDSATKIDQMEPGRKKRRVKGLFEQAVYVLTEEEELFNLKKNANPLIPWLKLLLGILSIGLSLSWLLHIVLNNLAHVTPFLNTLFIKLDNTFALLGICAYGFYTFYLLWCAIKGNVRFGLRIPLFCTVHPMQVGKTLMSSFLFNTALILLAAIVVTAFSADSFSRYANETAANALFATYVYNLKGLSVVWNVYLYILLSISGLSLLYLIICPKKQNMKVDVEDVLASKGIYNTGK